MLEQRRQFGFIDKGFDQIAFISEMRQYFFYRYQFLKAMITDDFSPIQFSHSADSNFLQQLILTKLFGLKVLHLGQSIIFRTKSSIPFCALEH